MQVDNLYNNVSGSDFAEDEPKLKHLWFLKKMYESENETEEAVKCEEI